MTKSTNSNAPTEQLVLVLGGTGKTGRRVIERLNKQGVQTRAAARSTTPAFDWHDQSNWSDLFADVTAVYITFAPDLAVPGSTDAIQAVVDKAAEHDVKQLVLLSGRGEEVAQQCERIVQSASTEWTIVRTSWFNQNFSEGEFVEMVLAGAITLPAGGIPEPFIDVDDIADVVVAALTEEQHNGELYEITGPRLLTFAEATKEIAHAAGRTIDYVDIPRAAFTAGITESGAPAEIAWLMDYLFETVLDGRNAQVTDGVQRALGRAPTDFADYARKTAATGVWSTPELQQAAGQ